MGWVRIEEKLDGHRLTVVVRGSVIEAWPRKAHLDLAADLRRRGGQLWERIRKLPPNTALDGELHSPGLRADQVTSVLRGNAEGDLTFSPFAVPWWCGADLRRSSFAVRDAWLRECGFQPPQLYARGLTDTSGDSPSREVLAERLRRLAAECAIEGFVLKQAHWGSWWRVKRVRAIDCVVIGVVPGKGKHRGRHGALRVALFTGGRLSHGVELVEVASVGKGRDEEWRDLRPDAAIGRVCEVSYEGTQSGGRLKFSAFVRWRDDKPSEECTLDQVSAS